MALDIKTHEPVQDFGTNGKVGAYVGVASDKVPDSARETFTIPNPVTVYKNILVTGARPGREPAA
jgi:hypothetical protein